MSKTRRQKRKGKDPQVPAARCYHCGSVIEGSPFIDSGEPFCDPDCVDHALEEWNDNLQASKERLIVVDHFQGDREALRNNPEFAQAFSNMVHAAYNQTVGENCQHSCGPGDFRAGGKCDERGCYHA